MSGTPSASPAQEPAPVDLHTWITQQVDRAEADSLSNLKGLRVACEPNGGGPVITGVVTVATRTAEGIRLDIARYGTESIDEAWADVPAIAAVLRRCEADRRILTRHRAWPQSDYCDGCDADLTTYLNDCPELLDLAHAHGLTDEILAGLDRPQPPESTMRITNTLSLADVLRIATPPITTSDVPEALRGPRWKPHH